MKRMPYFFIIGFILFACLMCVDAVLSPQEPVVINEENPPKQPAEEGIDEEPAVEEEELPDKEAVVEINEVLVAFIGDQSLSEGARSVLQLIKDEGTNLVLHQGDFDYLEDPDQWDDQINQILGENFPYLASVGNHDLPAWDDYQQKIKERVDRISKIECEGDIGVKSVCHYENLFIVLSGVGTLGEDHASYMREQLAGTDSQWRICSWHKNQRLMQIGGKQDEVGWEAYDECREGRAIIATGHEHSYSRTHLMESFENQTISSQSGTLNISKGKTFAFVSGLGGRDIRVQNNELAANDWWASVYSKTQNANYGALFCLFNIEGNNKKARCYFKDIDGIIIDDFYVTKAEN